MSRTTNGGEQPRSRQPTPGAGLAWFWGLVFRHGWAQRTRAARLTALVIVALSIFAITVWRLWASPAAPRLAAVVTRFSDYGPQRRIIVINVSDRSYGEIDTRELARKARLKVRGVWVPAEASSDALITPVDVEACYLLVTWRPKSSARRVEAFCVRHGLQPRFPKLCSWVVGKFSKELGRWRQVEVKVVLPPNLHLTGYHQVTLKWPLPARPTGVRPAPEERHVYSQAGALMA